MNTTAKGFWKPASQRSPMIANGLGRHSLGQAQLAIPLIAILTRFALPLAAGAAIYGVLSNKEQATGDPKTLGIDNWRIAYSALAGGIGTAAWLGGSILPENVRPISTAVGVLGTAVAVSVLFWPVPGDQEEKPSQLPASTIRPDKQAPVLAPYPLSKVLSIVPTTESREDYWRSIFKDQTYTMIVRNDSDREIQFYAGLHVYWEDISDWIFKSPPLDPKYGRKLVKVPPHGEVVEELTAPSVGGFWKAPLGNMAVSFEAFRERDLQDPFIISEAFPIYAYYVG